MEICSYWDSDRSLTDYGLSERERKRRCTGIFPGIVLFLYLRRNFSNFAFAMIFAVIGTYAETRRIDAPEKRK